jgi:hypothetical protein
MDGTPRPSRLPPEDPPRNGRHDPDEIRRAMKELRQEIHRDAQATGEDAQRLVDWKSHVQSHPLLSVGLAAAAGFLLAPTAKRVVQLTDKQLAALASKEAVHGNSEPAKAASVSAVSSVLLTIGAVAGRALLGQAVQRIETALLNRQQSSSRAPQQRPIKPQYETAAYQPRNLDEPRDPNEPRLY